jgi:serine/threonine protein kinase
LDFLHQQFILSRDLKLENVLYNAGSDTVLLTDFGLAKMLASAKSTTTTICGTVQYMGEEFRELVTTEC